MNYDDLKRIAKQDKVSVRDLIVMAPQNDPFYTGTEGDKIKAEWFADWWKQFGFYEGVHLRRIHYRIVSQGDATDCNGKPLQMRLRHWRNDCRKGRSQKQIPTTMIGYSDQTAITSASYADTKRNEISQARSDIRAGSPTERGIT